MRWIGVAALLAGLIPAAAGLAAEPAALEQLTTVELKERLATGCPVAILYNGGVEESGPHLALGKHNLRIYRYGAQLAQAIGDAILLPVMPFSPNDSARMAFAGTISLRPETWAAVNEDVIRSLIGGGFLSDRDPDVRYTAETEWARRQGGGHIGRPTAQELLL